MSSDNIVVRVQNVSKRYEIYEQPSARLKQFVLPRLRQAAGMRSKSYFREFWALSDISLELERGESFAIVGRNGSGKSTLLQIITGTLAPTHGEVTTQGRIAALLELGSGFSPDFTGRENVYLNAALLGLTQEQVEDRFDAIAAFADIGDYLEQPVKTYSSGMLLRLAIAVQTQIEPDILIVDEALAVGDALFQKRCFRQIERLLSNGCTLLFVSHDQEIVRTLTSRAIFLHEGKAKKYGASAEVLFCYREFLQQQEEAIFAEEELRRGREKPASLGPPAFGNLDVEIVSVRVVDRENMPREQIFVGDPMSIVIECRCNADLEKLNIAFRIRTKEGTKVTTWGTLNEDMPKFSGRTAGQTFWDQKFKAGQQFEVRFSGVCTLAANLYEIQAIAALEYDRFYANQRILHWIDEAAHLTVLLKSGEYVFDGVCDLGLRSHWRFSSVAADALTDERHTGKRA